MQRSIKINATIILLEKPCNTKLPTDYQIPGAFSASNASWSFCRIAFKEAHWRLHSFPRASRRVSSLLAAHGLRGHVKFDANLGLSQVSWVRKSATTINSIYFAYMRAYGCLSITPLYNDTSMWGHVFI